MSIVLRLWYVAVSAVVILCLTARANGHGVNQDLVSVLQSSISGKVFPKGSYGYEKRRLVHNGLCNHIYPDIIVTPHTSEDVSAIVKIARQYNQVISIRSGGHSFTCTSLKHGRTLTSFSSRYIHSWHRTYYLKVKWHRQNDTADSFPLD